MYKVRTYMRSLLKFLSRISLNATHLRWIYLFSFFSVLLLVSTRVRLCLCIYYTEIYFQRFCDDMLSWQFLKPVSHTNEICENSSFDNFGQIGSYSCHNVDLYLCKRYNGNTPTDWQCNKLTTRLDLYDDWNMAILT